MPALATIPNFENLIVDSSTASQYADQIGGKARNLIHLNQCGYRVPKFVVVLPELFRGVVENESSTEVRNEIARALEAYFPKPLLFAVRSSARDEDSQNHSFAGQLESYLNVARADVPEAVLKVWQSVFSERNLAYRQSRELDTSSVPPPAVIIQAMVDADFAGVAFTADPVSGDCSVTIISAVEGLGEALVSGQSSGISYKIDAGYNISALSTEDPNLAGRAVPEHTLRRISKWARHIEQTFAQPQDIEWALSRGRLYVLQSRPITTLQPAQCERGELTIWDNSNIGESYQGVTTPLTFSFARNAYEHVYRQFCRLMGVPETRIARNSHVFPSMIGYVDGRIYYNLLNWYRLVSILPGYKVNRHFMEQMMGVKEALPECLVQEIGGDSGTPSAADRLELLGTSLKTVWNLATIERQIDTFNTRFEESINAVPQDLSRLNERELMLVYRELENRLLHKWDAPLTNDFFAMIFYGLLRQLCKKWLGDENETMQNALLSEMSGIISAQPAEILRKMAEGVRGDARFINVLAHGTASDIENELPKHSSYAAAVQTYLSKFGDRCAGELKLETESLSENQLPLHRAVASFAVAKPKIILDQDLAGSAQVEQTAFNKLRHQPARLAMFRFVLNHARERVRQRENLRFQRTRLFGAVRRIFKQIGIRFQNAGVFAHSNDIFFLETSEIFAVIEGTSTTQDVRRLVEMRRDENRRSLNSAAPPDRFQTNGLRRRSAVSKNKEQEPAANGSSAIGCSPGRVIGRVRVLTSSHLKQPLAPDEIVVAERTDPGWILIFPQAAGLIVEHGSLLSHSAIVSRELGLPCIVAAHGATKNFVDGELIEMDGSSGMIRKLSAEKFA